MGDEQYGLFAMPPNPQQQLLHLQAGLAVECAKGFIHQQNLRIVGQGTSNGDPLHHAAGELFGEVVGKLRQPDFVEVIVDDFLALGGGHFPPFKAELDVLPHG